MKVLKRFPATKTVSVKTKYGDFEVPYAFCSDDAVYVALEPYDNLEKYEFSVVLLTGTSHDYDGTWYPEYNRLRVAVVKFTEKEIGGEPESEEWHDFIDASLRDVSPELD
jgi:hypothetical protein|nr:MAG TPA: hypothetical protein [Caudoviricetes sp.]